VQRYCLDSAYTNTFCKRAKRFHCIFTVFINIVTIIIPACPLGNQSFKYTDIYLCSIIVSIVSNSDHTTSNDWTTVNNETENV
jgi:hypothetical protein